MPLLELPHTQGCLVCGRTNPLGLHLSLHVNPDTSEVTTTFTPREEHIGFENIIHGGLLATVLDEAMVWCAIWASKRICVAAELTVRYRESARPADPLQVTATLTTLRSKLVTATGQILRPSDGAPIATATGKFVPLDQSHNQAFLATIVDEAATRPAAALLRGEAPE